MNISELTCQLFDGHENNIQTVLASYLHVLGPPFAKRRKGLLLVPRISNFSVVDTKKPCGIHGGSNTIVVDCIHCAFQDFGSHNDVVPSRFLNVLDGFVSGSKTPRAKCGWLTKDIDPSGLTRKSRPPPLRYVRLSLPPPHEHQPRIDDP